MEILTNITSALQQYSSVTDTENGDTAYRSTGSTNLNFFGTAGALRHDPPAALKLFLAAVREDYGLAVKNLLYLRDVRGGLGERHLFRVCWSAYCRMYPQDAAKLIPAVVACGRWDDLLAGLKTPAEPAVIAAIQDQLAEDLKTLRENGTVSLLAKWLPSVNTSSKAARKTARYLAVRLGMSEPGYRRMLSSLRRGSIIENNLREKDYSFSYAGVPSVAMHKYRRAFARNDGERYKAFITAVIQGQAKIHAGAIYPYQIISEYQPEMSDLQKQAMQVKWDEMKSAFSAEQTIVVRDGSGSMTWDNNLPMLNATALAILFAELQQGPFHNRFITFSSKPEMVSFKNSDTLYDKLANTYRYDDCSNTDISRVYDLLYNTDRRAETAADYVRRVVIISDMEFDCGTTNVPTYETMKQKFESAGFPLPELIYWNVCARRVHFAAPAGESNVKYVSGFSAAVLDAILHHGSLEAEEMMRRTLAKYDVWTAGLTRQ